MQERVRLYEWRRNNDRESRHCAEKGAVVLDWRQRLFTFENG